MDDGVLSRDIIASGMIYYGVYCHVARRWRASTGRRRRSWRRSPRGTRAARTPKRCSVRTRPQDLGGTGCAHARSLQPSLQQTPLDHLAQHPESLHTHGMRCVLPLWLWERPPWRDCFSWESNPGASRDYCTLHKAPEITMGTAYSKRSQVPYY